MSAKQTKDKQYLPDNPSSAHFHFLEVDENGDGWTGVPMTTEEIESSVSLTHYHEVKGFVVQEEIWVKKDKTSKPLEIYNVEHTHELEQEPDTVDNVDESGTPESAPETPQIPYIIKIKPGNYPGEEPIKYRFIVTNAESYINVLSTTIPGTDGLGTDPGTTPEDIKNLAKAYFKDLVEQYPNYTLKDTMGLLDDTDGNLEIVPAAVGSDTPEEEETNPQPEPVRIIQFDDNRYSERLFIGINDIGAKVPFDSPTTMGYLIFADKLLRDQKSGDTDWMQMLSSYTFPQVVIRPSEGDENADPNKLGPEDQKGALGEGELIKQNELINNDQAKLGVYNKENIKKLFAGNTAFPDLERGVNKLRGNDNAFVSIYGEVLHRINIRELLVRAMACLVAKLNPGDWVAIGCKIVIKEVITAIGFYKFRRIILKEWDNFVKSSTGKAFERKLRKTKQKLEKGMKTINQNVPAAIDRKKSDNLTIIDGKDPFSKEFAQIQQRELELEKNRRISEKAQIDEFTEDIYDLVDLDSLCDRFGDFINDSTKLLFAPGGLGFIKNNLKEVYPGIPKVPTIQLPQLPTKDIMKELIEAMERAAKELIVSSIVDLVKGIIDESLAQCDDIVNPPPNIPQEKSIGIPNLVPNLHGGAGPLQTNDLGYENVQDLGIPPHMFLLIKSLLDWMSEYLKPNQLCKLLSGTASDGLLRIVLSQVEERYPKLNIYVKTTSDVHRLFKRLGEKVDQTFCSAIISNVSAIADMCEDTIDNTPHQDALASKGFSAEEIRQILEDDRNRKLDALEKLSDYFINPDSIETQVPNALCTPSKKGLIPKNPAALQFNVDRVIDTVFDTFKYNFEQDAENFKESYIQIGTVVTDEFKVPESDVDFIKDLRAFPIDPISITFLESDSIGLTSETGQYLLLSPVDSLKDQAISLAKQNIISDGTEPGILGPIYKKEQRRMILPEMQKVLVNPENYVKSTHYEAEDDTILLKYPSIDPEKRPEVDTENTHPLQIGVIAPTFDLSGVEKVLDLLNEQEETEELLERKELLEKALSAETQTQQIVSMKYPTIAESIKFNENKELSSIEFREFLDIRERVLPSYEQSILGTADEQPGAEIREPGFHLIRETKRKASNAIEQKNKIDPDVTVLINELLTNTWNPLEAGDLYTSMYGDFDPQLPPGENNPLGGIRKNTYKPARSVLFAKLVSKKFRQELASSIANGMVSSGDGSKILAKTNSAGAKVRNKINNYIYDLENYLIAQHERNMMHFLGKIGFSAYKDSPILDLENFQTMDITPEDTKNSKSNACLDSDSDGLNEKNSLIDIDQIKNFVKDNYERKGCVDRAPEDMNPLRESMLEAGILSLIKLTFIEYCFNNLIALTDSKIFDVLTTEEVLSSVVNDVDSTLKSMEFGIKEAVLDAAVKYLIDRIELNIDLVDPYDPADSSLTLLEEDINRTSAIRYLCKTAIVEVIPVLKTIVSDFDFEGQVSTGLNGLLNYFLGANKLVDTPSNFIGSTADLPGSVTIQNKEVPESHVVRQTPDGAGPGPFVESERYKDFKNVVNITDYNSEILSAEDDASTGTFYLEKYIRMQYLSEKGKKFFFLPETVIDEETNEMIKITSIANLAKIITLQTMIHNEFINEFGPNFLSQPIGVQSGQISGFASKFGIDKDRFLDFQNNFLQYENVAPGQTAQMPLDTIKQDLAFDYGIRLVYKMPSSNLTLDDQGLPKVGDFTEETPVWNTLGGLSLGNTSSQKAIKNFKKVIAREASFLIRTKSDTTAPPGSVANKLTIGTFEQDIVTPFESQVINDHMILPIVAAEERAALNPGDPSSWTYFQTLSAFNYITENQQKINEDFMDLINDGKTINDIGKMLLDNVPISSTFHRGFFATLEDTYFIKKGPNGSHKNRLLKQLKDSPEVKLLTEYLFSPQQMKSLALEYVNVYPKSNTIDNKNFFLQTKNSLESLFMATLRGDDYKYTDPNSDGLQKQKHANKRKSTQINILPALQKLAFETGPMIVKGIAETIDPAVKTANTISILAGIEPKDINKVILGLAPPPIFPYMFYNIFPITPLGISYMALNFLEPLGAMLAAKKKDQEEECDNPTKKEITEANQNPDDEDYESQK